MTLKRVPLILILSVVFCLSCSSPQRESSQNIERDSLESSDTYEDQSLVSIRNLGDPRTSPQQEALNNLFIDFSAFSAGRAKITHNVVYDLGGSTTTCHFKEGELKYYTYQTSEEGGYFVTDLINMESENRQAARLTSESDGFFKWINQDTIIWYSVVLDVRAKYIVKESLSETPNFLESAPDSLISTVVKNKDKFKHVDGKYEWYLRREKKIGYFGKEIEESEMIRVDSSLFSNLVTEQRLD